MIASPALSGPNQRKKQKSRLAREHSAQPSVSLPSSSVGRLRTTSRAQGPPAQPAPDLPVMLPPAALRLRGLPVRGAGDDGPGGPAAFAAKPCALCVQVPRLRTNVNPSCSLDGRSKKAMLGAFPRIVDEHPGHRERPDRRQIFLRARGMPATSRSFIRKPAPGKFASHFRFLSRSGAPHAPNRLVPFTYEIYKHIRMTPTMTVFSRNPGRCRLEFFLQAVIGGLPHRSTTPASR